MALLADAGHNFGDVLGLGPGVGRDGARQPQAVQRRTFGFRRTTIVASVANALILLFVTGGLTWESIRRLSRRSRRGEDDDRRRARRRGDQRRVGAALPPQGKSDLNIRSAFLHLASDALLSLGVAVAGGVILVTGWLWLDPAVSIVLALTILSGTWSLMRSRST